MKLVEFTGAVPAQGPVFINPEQVVFVLRRYVGGATPSRRTTETTIWLVGDNDASVDVMGSAEEVASRLADTVTTFDQPEEVNNGSEDGAG